MNIIKRSFLYGAFLLLLVVAPNLQAQDRDRRAQRLVLDDNGADSTVNTLTILAPSILVQDVILTIPDPGTDTAEFMLTSGGGGLNSWHLGGNSETVPGTNFLGTSDSTELQLQVRGGSGAIANSLILNTNGSLQRDTAGTVRGANAVDLQAARSSATYVAAGAYSVIGGGEHNGIAPSADGATISGGSSNTINDGSIYSTIGGGRLNAIDTNAQYATIGAGGENTIGPAANFSTIGGGSENAIYSSASQATIGGGRANSVGVGSDYSTIAGGFFNRVFAGTTHATIGGGEDNRIRPGAAHSTIIGGFRNDIGDNAEYATISGGLSNDIRATADYATIGGGQDNLIDVFATYSTIGGGRSNSIGDSADYATIGGGRLNGIRAHGDYSTIGGGFGNVIDGQSSVIPGGRGLTLNADRSFGFLSNDGSNGMTISESDVAVFGNTNLWLANNTGTASQLRFYEPNVSTGPFPSTDFYVSFEAPPLNAPIEYVLPAAKPTQVGEVLKVSSVNGDVVTLTWGTDNTTAGRDGSDVQSSIGAPDDGSRLDSRMKRLAAQLEAGGQLHEAQMERIEALQTAIHAMQRHVPVSSSERIESKENVSVQSAE